MTNMQIRTSLIAFALLAGAFATGCQFYARGPEDYRKATRTLLETKSSQIDGCFDEVLKKDSKAAGTVVVHFTVAHDTGKVTDAKVLPESTAPAPLGECVVKAVEGLSLDPSDKRDGDATFVWEFQAS
jgi:TonB family protein